MEKVVLMILLIPVVVFCVVSLDVRKGVIYTFGEGEHDLALKVEDRGLYVVYTGDGILKIGDFEIGGSGVFNFEKPVYEGRFVARSPASVLGFLGVGDAMKIPGKYGGNLGKIREKYTGAFLLESDFVSSFKITYRSSYHVYLKIFSKDGTVLASGEGDGVVSLIVPKTKEFILFVEAESPSFEMSVEISGKLDLEKLMDKAKESCSSYRDVYKFKSEWKVVVSSSGLTTSCWRIIADSADIYSVEVRSKDPVGLTLFSRDELLSFSQGVGKVKLETKLKPGTYQLVIFSPSREISLDITFRKKPKIFKVKGTFAYAEVFRNGSSRTFDVKIKETGTYLLRVEGTDISVFVRTKDGRLKYENIANDIDVGIFLERGEEATMTIEAGPDGSVNKVIFREVLVPNFDLKLDFVCDGFETWLTLKFPKEAYRYFKNSMKPLTVEGYVELLNDDFAKSIAKYISQNCSDPYEALVSLVQKLDYMKDEYYGNYPKYPSETLVEGGGDCEDKSILLASMLRYLGYDVVFIELPDHMAVGVSGVTSSENGCFVFSGKEYCYQETTSEGWKLGVIPPEFFGRNLKIIRIPEVSE